VGRIELAALAWNEQRGKGCKATYCWTQQAIEVASSTEVMDWPTFSESLDAKDGIRINCRWISDCGE
jgi:hypothetical protein